MILLVVCLMARVRLDQAMTNCIADQVDGGLEAQLLEDMAAMGLHGAGADDELLGDLLVGQPA